MKIIFEKSIVSSKILKKFHIIKFDDLAFKKPGNGIPAKDFKKIIGKKLNKDIKKDHKFKLKDFQ